MLDIFFYNAFQWKFNKKNFKKQKQCEKKKPKRCGPSVWPLFFFFFAQKVDDMLSAILFKRNKIDLAFFPCFDFDH